LRAFDISRTGLDQLIAFDVRIKRVRAQTFIFTPRAYWIDRDDRRRTEDLLTLRRRGVDQRQHADEPERLAVARSDVRHGAYEVQPLCVAPPVTKKLANRPGRAVEQLVRPQERHVRPLICSGMT
jgi:hypothetical protein